MKPTTLFISNSIYFDESKNEGGVKLCTREYLALLKIIFNVVLFPVNYHINIMYRIRVKLGLNVYNDYHPGDYKKDLMSAIRENNVNIVFLNLSNTASIAELIKKEFGDKVKIVLCSHGNESGDFLHEATRFHKKVPFYRSFLSSWTLGSLLKKEAGYRQKYIDGILTVSPVEEALEKWIGAKKVLMIPRTVSSEPINWKPVPGRIGFMGDLSHLPNYIGVDEVCKALSNYPNKGIELRLVGSPENMGIKLAKTYSFVKYLGYLNKMELEAEVSAWAFFLNPVFYYSRGVSTKLAKALGWGLPVISTSIGCRGYSWEKGNPFFAESPDETARKINEYSTDINLINAAAKEIKELVGSSPSLESISHDLQDFLRNI
jgi:Glycosyl transferases group 1